MRIAVNVQTLVKDKLEGLGWFSYENLKRIVRWHPEHEFVFIFNKGIDASFIFADNVKAINIGPPFNRPLAWLLKFELFMPWYINRNKFDLYLSPDGWSSSRIGIKKFLVVHDINFEHYPEFLPFSFRRYYRYFFKRWVNSSSGIATVSNFSKHDIASTYGYDANKISVVYNGASNAYTPLELAEIQKVRNAYASGEAYFIFIGALHPRKNLANILLAFDVFKETSNSPMKFVVVGDRFYWDKITANTYEQLKFKSDVVFTGSLPQQKLAKVLGASFALTYVSLFEGFGIPLVEAMRCEIPIITSNTTSMPEIAGDAALTVDPRNVNDIAEAMKKLYADDALRQQLINRGIQKQQAYSWDKTAKALWQAIEKSLS